jgi:1,4-dihydroxy-2-naphthoate octaprenyltransferase
MTMSQNIQLSTNKSRIWWDTTRLMALPQSAMPALLGGLLAFARGSFNLLYFIIAFLGVLVVHLGRVGPGSFNNYRGAEALFRGVACDE